MVLVMKLTKALLPTMTTGDLAGQHPALPLLLHDVDKDDDGDGGDDDVDVAN